MTVDDTNASARDVGRNVFVVGAKRSGTTWTCSLLANHPHVVGVLHTHLITRFKELGAWWEGSNSYWDRIIGCNDDQGRLRDFLSESEFFASCRKTADVVLDKAFLSKPDAKLLVESQPENIDLLPLLSKLYPDASVVHVIRDPRSVFASWKSAGKTWSSSSNFSPNPVQFCDEWRRQIIAARSLANEGKIRYFEFSYEDMKSDGVRKLSEIHHWLGVDADPAIAKKSIAACEIEKLRNKSIMPQGFFRKGKTSGWRSELSNSEVHTVEFMLSDFMDEIGYERVNEGEIRKPGRLVRYEIKRAFLRLLSWAIPASVKRFLKRIYAGSKQ